MNFDSSLRLPIGVILITVVCAPIATAQRWMENLNRGVIAIDEGVDGVWVSWRLLGTDASDTAFDVFRRAGDGPLEKLNDQPLAGATHHRDRGVNRSQPVAYSVIAAASNEAIGPANTFTLAAGSLPRDYVAVAMQPPEGYHANDASVADLDGDGDFEFVVHFVGRGRDNSQSGLTTSPILHGYQTDGTLMWAIDLGNNIREGAHYTQFLVYDLDCDGVAEIVCKTADGTVDGVGTAIGAADADHRQMPRATEQQEATTPADGRSRGRILRRRGARFGYVLSGPEYLTVFNGRTGAAMATVDYIPPRHPDTPNPTGEQLNAIWGDDYGNRIDRFLGCVAYLDGERPSIVMSRGYYTRTVIAAWDWNGTDLAQRWVFDSDQVDHEPERWRGQGNHSVAVADVDDDGRDEIIFGAMVIDDDGGALYSTGLGHGDAQHTTDIDPARPGLETWSIHEHPPKDRPGVDLRNARTGEIYFAAAHGVDVVRGLAADIDPRSPGCELWGGSRLLWSAQGEPLGARPRSQNSALWWDGDLLRELLSGVTITKWNYEDGREAPLFDGRSAGVVSNNGSKSNPCLSVDLWGDWREELVARTPDSTELRIFTSTLPTTHRLHTLMHDPTYRLAIVWQNVGYNQPPHPGFFLGHGMPPRPQPNIRVVNAGDAR